MTFAMGMALNAVWVDAAPRSWTRSELLAIADKEAQRLKLNVDKASVAFDFHNSFWRMHLGNGGRWFNPYRKPWANMGNKLKGRTCWAVFYGLLHQTPGIGMFIFIDRETGGIIDHFTVPGSPQTLEGQS